MIVRKKTLQNYSLPYMPKKMRWFSKKDKSNQLSTSITVWEEKLTLLPKQKSEVGNNISCLMKKRISKIEN